MALLVLLAELEEDRVGIVDLGSSKVEKIDGSYRLGLMER